MSESECIFSIYLETDLDVYGLVSTIANMGDEMMIPGSRERSLKLLSKALSEYSSMSDGLQTVGVEAKCVYFWW